LKYLGKKLLTLITTFILVSLIVFFVFQIIPGDPVLIILGPEAEEAQILALRETLRLDNPLFSRYFLWLRNILRGDMGISVRYNMSVSELISGRLSVTLSLTLMSLLISTFFGILFGVIIGKYNDTFIGKILSTLSQIGLSIPSFWLGFMLSFVFGVLFSLLPTSGFVPFSVNFWGAIRSLILPSVAISIGASSVIIRFLKNSIAINLEEDYVRTAKSRGQSGNKILFGHVLRNALLPSITIIGLILADIVSGSIIIENIFNLPGIGQLLITAISVRDLPLLQSLCLYILFTVVLANTAVDVINRLIDPRIRRVK